MRRLRLPRRRRRNRYERAAEEVAVRAVALLWAAKVLVRGARFSSR